MYLSKYELALHKALAQKGKHTVKGLAETVADEFKRIRDATAAEVEETVLNILEYFLAWKWVKMTSPREGPTHYKMTVVGRAKTEPEKRKPRPPLKASR